MLNEFVETLKSVNVDISELQPCLTSSGCSVLIVVLTNTFRITFQLCGRAGRSGLSAQAHMFYSRQQKFKDPKLQQYCFGNENCRRITLLRSVGSLEDVSGSDACCDVCTPSVPCVVLDLLVTQKRKRRHLVRRVGKVTTEQLRLRLVAEREKLMSEHPGYRMIGADFVCSDAAIGELCQQAKYCNNIDDVDTYHIRPEFRDRIFNVLMETVSTELPPKRSRCYV